MIDASLTSIGNNQCILYGGTSFNEHQQRMEVCDETWLLTFDNNNNSNSNSSVSSPSTNNLINPANAALTPGFVDRSRKSIGPTFFSSIHLQRGKGDNYRGKTT